MNAKKILLGKFATVGVFATLTYLVLANALIKLTSLPPEQASICAYLGGMVVSYLGQSKLTFGVPSARLTQIAKFGVMSSVGLAISFGTLQYAAFYHPSLIHVATVFVAVAVPAFSFFAMKVWVFVETTSKLHS